MDYENGYKRMEDIIARFDEHLTQKASKTNMQEYQDFV